MLVCCLVCVSMTTTWGRKPLQKSRSSRRTFTWTGISTEIRKDVTASEQAANTRMKNLQPSAWKASASNFTLKLKLKRIEKNWIEKKRSPSTMELADESPDGWPFQLHVASNCSSPSIGGRSAVSNSSGNPFCLFYSPTNNSVRNNVIQSSRASNSWIASLRSHSGHSSLIR